MSRYVFILGAGASKECGAPLMGDFLERAADLNRNANGTYRGDFALVAQAIAALQQVHSKAELDLYNLESVFGALEMAKMLGQMPGYPAPEGIRQVILALRRAIAQTLEKSIDFPCPQGGSFRMPDSYLMLVRAIAEIREKEGGDVSSIISFNYDILAEMALYLSRTLGFKLGYSDHISITDGNVPVIKLHGSLSWGTCPKCKELVSLPMSFVREGDIAPPDDKGMMHLEISSLLAKAKLSHCDQAIDPIPVIVPPSWNKTEYAEQVGHIWQEAARQLSDAENIIVCGYSLPETDVFFKHLFALGSVGTSLIRHFWVIDPDPGGGVERRFRAMLGKAALDRFKMFRQSFSDLHSILDRELGLPELAQQQAV
jgi:hypothetical protein